MPTKDRITGSTKEGGKKKKKKKGKKRRKKISEPNKKNKERAPGIPTWSHSVVLTRLKSTDASDLTGTGIVWVIWLI
jgi:hypothetical protein